MIRAIVTDVDGVIVGKIPGVNFPLPSPQVIRKLKELHENRIPVVLNTAKIYRGVLEIIKQANLQNPHISDGGSVIIDPLSNKIIKKHVFGKLLAKELVKASLDHGFYTEFYGVDNWYVQKNQAGVFSEKRVAILQQDYTLVPTLLDHVDAVDVIKIYSFVQGLDNKKRVEAMLQPFHDQINFVWTHHPTTYPTENVVITVKGVSKRSATLEVLEYLHIAPEETLGIGDTLGDWNFMSVCGYAGVTGRHSDELIERAITKSEGKYFLSKDADHDGFLEIAGHFFG